MAKILIIATCSLLLSSCFLQGKTNAVILPDENTPAFSGLWAVIINPYVAYMEEPDSQKITSHGRLADIEPVTGKRIIPNKNKAAVWYGFAKGWLPESAVSVYDNKLKAETAASRIR